MVKKGNISIHAENIMPIIKQWLYSDKDIFIRELVSNGCDAITKFKIINPENESDFRVIVEVDEQEGQLRFVDNGIGMTEEEIETYINQVAFSSAEEFLKNYVGEEGKTSGIIGHFGLGFYSAFMVAKKVSIETLSYKDGSKPVLWESEDGMSFSMRDSSKKDRGTIITLDISEEEKDFLTIFKVREVLEKYCSFMPYPIFLQDMKLTSEKSKDDEDENEKDSKPDKLILPEPIQINDTAPLWLKTPNECTDEEYKEFYKKTFNSFEDPLFWVHLNVDYPFKLKGILYFPKLANDFGTREGEIKLFSEQVFVADNIKEVIPEFLMLLRGVIDCPDLPLNVSRSFLQNDGYVRRLSAHITKKVADKLNGLFNTQREKYEQFWDDIHPFVKFGCLKDQKFFESVKGSLLLRSTDSKYYTLEEYLERNKEKSENKIIYTSDQKRQAPSIAMYAKEGIDVVVLENIIDPNFISFMEYGSGSQETLSFIRVDGDISSLLAKDKDDKDEKSEMNKENLQNLFRKSLDNELLEVEIQTLADPNISAMLIEDEQIRRFKDMSKMYGEGFSMPDKSTLVLNEKNPIIQAIAEGEMDKEDMDMLCQQVYDLARMSSAPLEDDEITNFLLRSQKIMAMAIK